MKKYIVLLIMLLAAGGYAAAQDNSALQNYRIEQLTGPILTSGKAVLPAANVVAHENRFYLGTENLRNYSRYRIGEIPMMDVRNMNTCGFFAELGADSILSYAVVGDTIHHGNVLIDQPSKLFEYQPASSDIRWFTLLVKGTPKGGGDPIQQEVIFRVTPVIPPETVFWGISASTSKTRSSSGEDAYITVVQRGDTVAVSSTELIFDKDLENSLQAFVVAGQNKKLTCFAETVRIRGKLKLPGGSFTVYARKLIFEANSAGEAGAIDITPEKKLTTGSVGANCGSISIYVKEIETATPIIRFFANGGDAVDGKGGDGGKIISNQSKIKNLCNYLAGVGKNSEKGKNGKFTKDGSDDYVWVRKEWLLEQQNSAEDLFKADKTDDAKTIINEYVPLMGEVIASNGWEKRSATDQSGIRAIKSKLEGFKSQMDNLRDYYGNWLGWVPLLSFEMNLTAYKQEIQSAAKILNLAYQITNAQANAATKRTVAAQLRAETQTDMTTASDNVISFRTQVTSAEAKVKAQQEVLDELQEKIEMKDKELQKKAEKNVRRRNILSSIFGSITSIAGCIPGYGQLFVGGGALISKLSSNPATAAPAPTALTFDSAAVSTRAGLLLAQSQVLTHSLIASSDSIEAKKSNGENVVQTCTTFGGALGALSTTAGVISDLITKNYTPADEVEAELATLRAQSSEYQDLLLELEKNTNTMLELVATLQELLQSLNDNLLALQTGLATYESLNQELFNNAIINDLGAVQYAAQMERKVKDRLEKYRYLVARAYEYRILEKFPSDKNLNNMFDRFKSYYAAHNDGSPLTAADFESLTEIFKDEVGDIISEIVNKYNQSPANETQELTYILSPDELETLNEEEPVTLNFYEAKIFPDGEDIRIRDIQVIELDAEPLTGAGSSSRSLTLKFTHDGLSKIRKNGNTSWFNHRPQDGQQSPFTWSDLYNFQDKKLSHSKKSVSEESLFISLLGESVSKIERYSLPSAWAKIFLTKSDNNGYESRINAAKLKIIYDYANPIPSQSIVDISTSEINFYGETNRLKRLKAAGQAAEDATGLVTSKTMTPVIGVSFTDNNGRDLGKGNFSRTFSKGNTSVKFEAQDVYGVYKFVGWTNNRGETVSASPTYTVSLANNAYLKANYEYAGAALNVASLVSQGKENGSKTLAVSNSGSDLESLYWTAELVENPDWVRIVSGSDGADDGEIVLQFTALPQGQTERQTVLLIETDHSDISKEVVVKQTGGSGIETPTVEWAVGPNPFRNTLTVTDAEGYIMHLTNIAGRAMFSARIASNNEILDVSDIPAGVYVLTMQKNGVKHSRKVLKI
ncbi:MAG: T9SS type A sorting domain-containing protein [Prevotella sp.]|nr:T9SS type A sorting domain-containing protein [Prevotella sp.]